MNKNIDIKYEISSGNVNGEYEILAGNVSGEHRIVAGNVSIEEIYPELEGEKGSPHRYNWISNFRDYSLVSSEFQVFGLPLSK